MSLPKNEDDVAVIYKRLNVAENYLEQRFNWSWSKLLDRRQATEVNRAIHAYQPARVLEIAPGPARIATQLKGIRKGIMIDYSQEMLTIAKVCVQKAGLEAVWDVRYGNAFDLELNPVACDFVYSFRFVRHFRKAERERLYHGFRLSLRPKGFFMLDIVNRVPLERLEKSQGHQDTDRRIVYDEAYSPTEFKVEMRSNGFEVLFLKPVIRHFALQSWISYKLDHRMRGLAGGVVRVLEEVPSKNPLEWIALCQKRD